MAWDFLGWILVAVAVIGLEVLFWWSAAIAFRKEKPKKPEDIETMWRLQ